MHETMVYIVCGIGFELLMFVTVFNAHYQFTEESKLLDSILPSTVVKHQYIHSLFIAYLLYTVTVVSEVLKDIGYTAC